jgi:hypothetical protein
MAECYILQVLLPLGSFWRYFWYDEENFEMLLLLIAIFHCSKLYDMGKEYGRKETKGKKKGGRG